jgi:glutathione S-transferase
MNPIRLYRVALSGHSHRVELMLNLLRLPHELVNVNLAGGEHKQPPFLQKNPLGQVPVIEDGNLCLADSNAILVYLATRYDESGRWHPREAVAAARVQRWLSLAAGPLFSGACVARLVKVFKMPLDHERARVIAQGLFTFMESHLAGREYLVGELPTIADVALYTYTAHAPEGDVSLAPYAALRAWLARVEALPGFVPMVRTPLAA